MSARSADATIFDSSRFDLAQAEPQLKPKLNESTANVGDNLIGQIDNSLSYLAVIWTGKVVVPSYRLVDILAVLDV